MPELTIELNNANIAASTRTANLLASTELANVPSDAPAYQLEVFNVSSASGVNATFQSSSQTLINDKEIVRIGTTLNENDHFVAQFIVQGGSPLVYTLRETAAAATTDILTKIRATPIYE